LASSKRSWAREEGTPWPLGVCWLQREQSYNFALYSKHASEVKLLLYEPKDLVRPVFEKVLEPRTNKSGRVWHCRVSKKEAQEAKYYAYSVDGPPRGARGERIFFDREKVLLDPYAPAVFFPPEFDREAAKRPGSNAGRAPLGILESNLRFDWGTDRHPFHEHDAIVYELHVKGFTAHPTSGVADGARGTYRGLIEKLPYLVELGVTIIELMPVFQFDPREGNFWGYMPLNFFAPHHAYATSPEDQHNEFREMVREIHRAGIEVVVDAVYNHTVEGDDTGPTYSFRGIDDGSYYFISTDEKNRYANYSGTGNALNCSNYAVRKMIVDSMRYWLGDLHLDGFRFDLASVFTRDRDGQINYVDPPILSEISSDPALAHARLIAEPWDAAGAYQLGRSFPGVTWLQWNGLFRDDIRRFVRGDPGLVGRMMLRLYGSDDLFPDTAIEGYHAYQSVNYVASHDGFTLYDLVAYNERNNWANGHDNKDGASDNLSWNCGYEGHEGAPKEVVALRKRQVKNFCCLLFLANGTPMFRAGDEFCKSQGGNTNPYNQDNETTWLDWRDAERHADVLRFFKKMIAFRKAHRSIARSRFWREDVRWFGTSSAEVDFSPDSRAFAYVLLGGSQGDDDLYVMINASSSDRTFRIHDGDPKGWLKVVDTSSQSPRDFIDDGTPIGSGDLLVAERSVIVLLRPRKVRS
jgi:isoamylase